MYISKNLFVQANVKFEGLKDIHGFYESGKGRKVGHF